MRPILLLSCLSLSLPWACKDSQAAPQDPFVELQRSAARAVGEVLQGLPKEMDSLWQQMLAELRSVTTAEQAQAVKAKLEEAVTAARQLVDRIPAAELLAKAGATTNETKASLLEQVQALRRDPAVNGHLGPLLAELEKLLK